MIMSRAAFGPNKEAAMPAGQLFQRAANIVHGAQMQRELEAGPELAGLGKWIDQPGLLE